MDSLQRLNVVSDELLLNASAMCLAPSSPILLSTNEMRMRNRSDTQSIIQMRMQSDENEISTRRMGNGLTSEVQFSQRRVAPQCVRDVLGSSVIDLVYFECK